MTDDQNRDRITDPRQSAAKPYSSRIISNYIRFVERHYPHVDIYNLMLNAQLEYYQIEDENHWLSQEQVDLFHEKLVKATGNQDISREAGRYAASTHSSGVVKSYVLGFVNPVRFCEMIGRAASTIVRSCVWEATRLGPNQVQIKVR